MVSTAEPSVTGQPSGATKSEPDPRRWIILAILCIGLLIVGIDGTIVNVALPTLVREIGASSSELQWIVDAYTIIFASFLLIAGNSGDRLGRKGCFIGGLIVFGTGSFACSKVHTPGALILMRGIQGLGAAFIMPATLSILANVFTHPEERARAIALWAGVSGLGVAIGPVVGGFLLEHFWWGSIFLVNVPLVILTVIGVIVIVPNSRDEHAPALDFIGTVLSTIGIVGLLYGVIEGPNRGWGDPLVVVAFVGAIVLLTAFTFWERHSDHPILDVRFFANPRFTAASISVTLVFFAMFGSAFFVSQYLQFVLGYSALQSGFGLLPVAGVLMIAAPTSAKLVAHYGTKYIVMLGLFLVAVALALFSRSTATSGYPLVAAVLVILGAGMGLAMAPATDSIMGSLPPEKAGVGSAMNDTTREIGGALGVAILGSITSAVYSSRIVGNPSFALLQKASPAAAEAVRNSVGGASVAAEHLPAAIARRIDLAANNAFVDGMTKAVLVGAAMALLGVLVAYFWLPARAEDSSNVNALVDGAALRIDDPEQRRSLTAATLGLLADAGMSSLTYNGVASRSGISTATLERYWGSRVDAVTDAMHEVFEANPIPDTGNLRADLNAYLTRLGEVLSQPRARAVVSALLAEAATNVELANALRERVIAPRRAELVARVDDVAFDRPADLDTAVDQLIGPVFYRALISGTAIDETFIRAVVDAIIPDELTRAGDTRRFPT